MTQLARSLTWARQSFRIQPRHQQARTFRASPFCLQERSESAAHRDFYKTHGRAIFKALTLAFFSYQTFYWMWITLETEENKDKKGYEIKALEGEVRLLEEGRKSHRPAEVLQDGSADVKR